MAETATLFQSNFDCNPTATLTPCVIAFEVALTAAACDQMRAIVTSKMLAHHVSRSYACLSCDPPLPRY
jgi:hypothetical protein